MKKIFLGLVIVVVATVVWIFFERYEQRRIERIVSRSGLHFQVPPRPLRQDVEYSGLFMSNMFEIFEFQLDAGDAAILNECSTPGFQQGVPSGWSMFLGMTAQPKNLETVCWRKFENKSEMYFFAVFENFFVYRVIIL